MRHTKLALVVLVACALALGGCEAVSGGPAPELLEPVDVKADTARVEKGDVEKIAIYDSAVTPYSEALFFELDGTVESVNVIPGQYVEAGEALIELDESAVRERYDALLDSYDYVSGNYAFQNELAALDVEGLRLELTRLKAEGADAASLRLKEADVAAAETALRQAKEMQALELDAMRAELEELSAKLGQNVLRAPFAGRVAFGPLVEKYGGVKAYDPVLYLADDSRLSLVGAYVSTSLLNASERCYAIIGEGHYEIEPVEISREEYISITLSGGAVPARFTLKDTAGLESGMYAAVVVVTNAAYDALTVPVNSLYKDTEGRYVYVMRDGVRERRGVTVGVQNDSCAEITSGLEEGEYVYVKD